MQSKKALRDPDITLSEYVYRELLERIRDGRFPPNQRLREADLSSMLLVSRTPVREALRRLESDQVVHFGTQGYAVSSLSVEEAVDLYSMREILEGAAARFAAAHALPQELQEMRIILAEQEAAIDDPEKMARLNEAFHHTLYRAARNRYLFSALRSLDTTLRLLGRTTFSTPNRSKTALKEHEEVVGAIFRGDAEAAEAHARAHIRNASAIRLKMMTDDKLLNATKAST